MTHIETAMVARLLDYAAKHLCEEVKRGEKRCGLTGAVCVPCMAKRHIKKIEKSVGLKF